MICKQNDTVNPPPELMQFLETNCRRMRRMVALCHNDLDGLTASVILKIFLSSVFNKSVYIIHSYFGIAKNDIRCLEKKKPLDLLWIVDKGTIEQYHELSKYSEKIVIVDHHKPEGTSSRSLLVYNPLTLGSKISPPSSFLLNRLASCMGFQNTSTDFLTLVGSRSDNAFDPVTDRVHPSMSEFYEEAKKRYCPLFKLKFEKPTRFDLERRDCTTLLNQITEVLNCATYARDYVEKLKTSGSEFAYRLLSSFCKNLGGSPKILEQETFDLDSFMKLTDRYSTINSLYGRCRASFEKTLQVIKNMKLVKRKDALNVYFLCGALPKTSPAVGKIELHDLKAKGVIESGILVLVNQKRRGFTLSTRSVNGDLDLGDFMERLVGYLKTKFDVNFLLTKPQDKTKKEMCVIDIWHEEEQMKEELIKSLSGYFELESNLRIFPRGGRDDPTIRAGRIDLEGIHSTYKMIMKMVEKFDAARAVSLSAGRIMSTVPPPERFLEGERWGTQLIADKKVIWLCVYHIADFERIENEEKRKRVFRDAILAHNKIMVLASDGRIHSGEEAMRSLISGNVVI